MIIPADGAPRLPLQLDSFNNAIFYTQLPLLLCLLLSLSLFQCIECTKIDMFIGTCSEFATSRCDAIN